MDEIGSFVFPIFEFIFHGSYRMKKLPQTFLREIQFDWFQMQ